MAEVIELKNKITLIVEPNTEVQSAAYSLLIPGGQIRDPETQIGAGSLLVELTTRAAAGQFKAEFQSQFDDNGINHSEGANTDHYNYRGSCLASKIREALTLLSKMVLKPELPEESIAGIKSLLVQEIQMNEDDPFQKTIQEFNKRYHPKPFNRPSCGIREDIENLDSQKIKDIYQNLYKPAGSVLSVAGNVKVEEVKNIVESLFQDWEGSLQDRPNYNQDFTAFSEHLDYDSNQVQIALASPATSLLTDDYYVAKVANSVLSGGMFGRLFSEVREKRGLCYTVFSSYAATPDYGRMLCYASTTTERANETLDVMLETVKGVTGSLSDEELTRAKVDLLSGTIISGDSTSAKTGRNASDWWNRKKLRNVEEIKSKINAVNAADIKAYLEKFPIEPYSILTLGKDKVF